MMSEETTRMSKRRGQSIQSWDEQKNKRPKVEEGFVIKVYSGNVSSLIFKASLSLILHDEGDYTSDEITVYPDPFDCSEVVVPMTKMEKIGSDARIVKVEFCAGISTKCYVKRIEVNSKTTSANFSVFRMVEHHHWDIVPDPNTSLPQKDDLATKEKRREALKDTREEYKFKQPDTGLPAQVDKMPCEEEFSFKYGGLTRWDLSEEKEMDFIFANQRINGLNPSVIQLCTDPEYIKKIAVSGETLKPFIGGLTIEQAIAQKCLYVCDLKILEDVKPKAGFTLCAPIGLFFVDKKEGKDGRLKPVAIQLFQEPATDNPVFLPEDGWNWTLAKMWFNNADAAYHQSITHLGFTHLLMEGVAVTTHRQLSQHHPIFKMLAPHFLFLIAIDSKARETLINPGGIIDTIMNAGLEGSFEIIRKRLTKWRMDVDGTLPVELVKRGVEDTTALPNYHFRDDALRVYDVIKTYATDYVKLYYKNSGDLQGDWEIQAWAKELTAKRDSECGGCGLQGVPGNGQVKSVDDLITILTSIIYTCSVGHAAANFAQYDEYGFHPNFPGLLKGQPPKDKKRARSEVDIVQALPNVGIILETMVITRVLSDKETKSLGDFEEVPTITDGRALHIVKRFRDALANLSDDIETDNSNRKYPYTHVDPKSVPNAISI
ncbi:allene oxide synthase-lipoxygenase protein-like [Littorina saxatilis]|uniref:allene oxide synthase-lipoxygenase protein-like n=1 Tax=Littorina saxatilis TaxID=31220 RepID=UPI0038B427C6